MKTINSSQLSENKNLVEVADLAIIGGTGVYDPAIFTNSKEITINNKYGQVSALLGDYEGKRVAFISRHGSTHNTPPHKINYRANVYAIKQLGATRVLATAASGSINKLLQPGKMLIIDQFIDMTKNRMNTFFDGENGVLHVDMTTPYCPQLNSLLANICQKHNIDYVNGATYVCTEGPRFETPAEIKMYANFGGDLVGMTNVPEVVLARELEICYSTIATVTNFCAGLSTKPLTHKEVIDIMNASKNNLQKIIKSFISSDFPKKDCPCPMAASELGRF